jgi:hypothetical protein
MALRYLDEQPEQMQEQAAPSRIRYLDEPQTNNGDIERQVLAEMPWIQRQAVAAGGVLAKAGQGLKGLVGGDIDQDLVRQANIASEEAPVGAFAGEVIKYAPSILAPQIIPAQMAAAGAIGAATDTTGKRIQSGAMDAAFAGLGTKIGRDVLPWMAGKTIEGVTSARQALGGVPAERAYGSLDKAREALRKIIGEKNIPYASGALDNVGDVRSAQALANMPDAEGVAALDRLISGKSGIQAAENPMEAAMARTGQTARQEEARQFAMQKMARGATAEESAAQRQLMKQRLEGALGPVREGELAAANVSGGVDVDNVIGRITSALDDPRIGASQNVSNVLSDVSSRIADWVERGGGKIDANALYTIRKEAINESVGKLLAGADPIASKRLTAKLSNELKPFIDDAIESAGGAGWKDYITKYGKGLEAVDRVELLDVMRGLQKKSPKQFMEIVAGEKPSVVQGIMSGKAGIENAVSQNTLDKLKAISSEMARDRSLKEMGKSPEAKAAVGAVLDEGIFARYLPNILQRYVTVANEAISSGKMHVQRGMYRELEKAMRDPKRMKELIDMLPPEQRSKMIGFAAELGKGGGTVGAGYASEQRQ